MNKYLRIVFTILGLIIIFIVLYFLLPKLPKINSEAIIGFVGIIIGALISTASQSWISYFNRKNALRLAAIDRRLSTHQEAYTLWRKLNSNLFDKQKIHNVVAECQDWWDKNCLYLDPEARMAFYRAYISANNHYLFVEDRSDINLIKKNMADIQAAGIAIVKGVTLPTIGESESKNIKV